MKKLTAVILVLILLITVSACGNKEETTAGNKQSSNKVSAENYHKLLEGKDSVFYYEADVTEEYPEDGMEAEKSIMAEARDGKGRHVILTGTEKLDTRQIETEDAYYTVFEPDKEYTKELKEDLGEEDIDLTYKESSTMELGGTTYSYDEYQDEYEMEGFSEDSDDVIMDTYLYIKRYLMDDSGALKAIMYIQQLKGKTGDPIYRKVETITKLEENKVPDGIFDIPKGYKDMTDEEYADEDVWEE